MKIKVFRGHTRGRWRPALVVMPFAVILTAAAAPAGAAIRYIGTRSIGPGMVDLSIETDGKIGTLAAADILAWTVTLRDPSSAFPLRMLTNDGANGSLKSTVVVGGAAVTATPTALSFTYGLGDLEFDANYTIRPLYQIVSNLCSTGGFGNAGACEQFDTGSDYYSQHVQYALHPATGTIVIGTAAAVTEPAAWSLMIVGFGLIGRMLRVGAPTGARRVGAGASDLADAAA